MAEADVTDTAWRVINDPDDKRHGTVNGYNNYDCRCDRCKKAHADDAQKRKTDRRNAPTPRHVHGTVNGYDNYGCRCTRCKAAHTGAARRRRAEKKQEAN